MGKDKHAKKSDAIWASKVLQKERNNRVTIFLYHDNDLKNERKLFRMLLPTVVTAIFPLKSRLIGLYVTTVTTFIIKR